jgi:tight adherence protein B
MPYLVIGFVGIMLFTFTLVAVVYKPSSMEKSLGLRVASIQTKNLPGDGLTPDAAGLMKITKSSRFGSLERLLDRYQFSKMLQSRIIQADSKTTVASLVISSLLLAVAGYFAGFLFVPILPGELALAVLAGSIPYAILSFKRSRRLKAFDGALPEAIDTLGRALRAGYAVVGSIEMISQQSAEPVASEFGEVFNQQNYGLPLRDALMMMLQRVPSSDLRVLVTAILVQRDTGGNLVEILDRTSFVIRERQRIHGEIRIHTAQGRFTGWILTLLPVAMLFLLNMVSPGYSNILFHDPRGQRLMYIGLGLLITGGVIIRQIIKGIEV